MYKSREKMLTRTNMSISDGRSLYITCWCSAPCLQLCLEKVWCDSGSGCYWEGIRRRKRKVEEEEEVLGQGSRGQGSEGWCPCGEGKVSFLYIPHPQTPRERSLTIGEQLWGCLGRDTPLPCTHTPTHTHTQHSPVMQTKSMRPQLIPCCYVHLKLWARLPGDLCFLRRVFRNWTRFNVIVA